MRRTIYYLFGCLALLFVVVAPVFAKDCVDKIEDVEWCVEGIKLEGYRFPSREFEIELDLNSHPFMLGGRSRFTALVNWWNVEVKINKNLCEVCGDTVIIAGYFDDPDYRHPGLAIIFVRNNERKKQIENDIKVARKKFAENCFRCEQLGIRDPGSGSSKIKK